MADNNNNNDSEVDETPIVGLVKSDRLSDFDTQLEILQSDPKSPLYSENNFENLGLKEELLKGIYAMGFSKPSKIQEKALPTIIKSNNNLVAQSQSGTGKTATFTLGMLNIVDPKINEPQAICVAPSHELALQIYGVICKIGQFTQIKPMLVIPEAILPQGNITNQIIVGTSGKILDLITKRKINTKHIKMFVLDEADFMIQQKNQKEQVLMILKFLPKNIKFLLFSATFSVTVDELIKQYVPQPYTEIRLKRAELTVDKIIQYYINCESPENKSIILSEIFGYISIGQTVVFTENVKTASYLATKMTEEGFEVSLLHGGLSPLDRVQVMQTFKDGKSKILIATNVIARGIDVLQVSLVINFDLPLDSKLKPDPITYLHRTGRVGRFGRSGVAITFVHDATSMSQLNAISTHLGHKINELKHEDIGGLSETLKNLKDLTPLKK